jgi:hypothetical protein
MRCMGAGSMVRGIAASPLGSFGHPHLCYCTVVKVVKLAASLTYAPSFLQFLSPIPFSNGAAAQSHTLRNNNNA